MKIALAELKRLSKPMIVLVVLQLLVLGVLGKLDVAMLIGTMLGVVMACVEFCMIGHWADKAVKAPSAKAPIVMTGGYFLRLGIIAVCIYLSFSMTHISSLGLILPLFYPRLAIYYYAIKRKGESD